MKFSLIMKNARKFLILKIITIDKLIKNQLILNHN